MRSKIDKWITNNLRAYYRIFYAVTGIAFLIGAISLFFAHPEINDRFLGVPFFIVAYLCEFVALMYFAITAKKPASDKTGYTRGMRVVFLLTTCVLIVLGFASLFAPGSASFTIFPFWQAFALLWVGPLIWYLPTDADEYIKLRDRLDAAEAKIDRLEAETGDK